MSISNRGIEFLIYATLGIVPEEIYKAKESEYKDKYGVESYDNYRILKCAQRAYLDLNRTLVRIDKDSDNSDFSNAISNEIAKNVYYNRQKNFNERKSEAFKLYEENTKLWNKVNASLKETGNNRSIETDENEEQKCFHYGQFQKWINMTFKYMDVLGMLNEEEERLLDIPLDSYIMKAMSPKGIVFPRNNGDSGPYTDNSVKWSRLTKAEYNDIVDAYRGCSDIKNSPIEWEHRAWIIMAEKEKKVIK